MCRATISGTNSRQRRIGFQGLSGRSQYRGERGLPPGGDAMDLFKNQFKQVLRRLGRAPMFTAITLVTLAVGVGASTAVFSVLEGVLLKPLPYPHTENLVSVKLAAP